MTIGEKILSLRKARGWSQEELADKIGVSRQAVSRWEADSAKPDADKIILICDLFGVSADYLLRENYAGEMGQLKQNALVEAIRRMPLWESVCAIISLFGLLITVMIAAFASNSSSVLTSYLFYASIICIFAWPAYRFIKWTNS